MLGVSRPPPEVPVLSLLSAAPAFACGYLQPPPFAITADPADTVPPGAAVPETPRIRRGTDGVRGDDGVVAHTSCDDVGEIVIPLGRPAGAPGYEGLGYEVSVAGPALDGLAVDPAPRAATEQLVLWWSDGATRAQAPLDLVVTVVVLDRAGNRSAPVRVAVTDPGR